jgi:DHA1 family tetracycline resistance protein-like MFS transporter
LKKQSPLLPIFLIVLVDVMGFTIVFPLLAMYAEKFGASALTATLLTSVYAACSMVSTPVIGRLSDQFGRKPLLMISQAGTLAGFLVLGFAESLWMVFVGRILDGITAGNLSIAQAYISDHTAPENRAKAFGVIGVAFGIGFSFGPALGGWLGDYGLHVPFLAASCLSFASIMCTWTLLPSQLPPQVAAPPAAAAAAAAAEAKAPPPPAGRRPGVFDFSTYAEYFRRPGLGALYLQFFLFTFAFSCFTSGFALFAERRFTIDGHPWTQREVSWMFTYSGVLGIILQGGLIGRLVKRFGEVRLAIAGFAGAATGFFLLGAAQTIAVLVLAATVSAFGNGVLRPVITSRITQSVGRQEQGVALGISGSLSSFAMVIAPPCGGAFINSGLLTGWGVLAGTVAAIGFAAALASRAQAKRAAAAT